MSAAPFHSDGSGHWVVSDAPYLRLVIDRGETKSVETEDSQRGEWTDSCFSGGWSAGGLKDFLQERLRSLPEVLRVKIAERAARRGGGKVLHIWTSLSSDDRTTRFKVYEIEQQIVDHFPELLFEFHSHLERDAAPDGDAVVYEPNT